MKIGVFGAGAIGCYLGGKLLSAGHQVVLVGRHPEDARQGLYLTDYAGHTVALPPERIRYETHPSALVSAEAVLVTVKSQATDEAGATLAGILSGGTVVASFQNGVSNAARLRQALPKCTVLAGTVPFNVVSTAPGHFHNGTSGPLALERARGKVTLLAAALAKAGFALTLHDDLERLQWGKLLINLNNSVNALAGIPLKDELRNRGYRRVVAACIDEGLRALKAAGRRPARLGRMVPSMAPFVMRLPNPLFERVAAGILKVDATARSSMQDDLAKKRTTEIDYLNGEIVALAKRFGVPAPVNEQVVALVKEAEGRRAGSPRMSSRELCGRVL